MLVDGMVKGLHTYGIFMNGGHVLVTGSSGMIGTRVCERLIQGGFRVTGVDWKPNMWSKEVDALTINVDLRDQQTTIEALPTDIDLVIHLAANARVHDLVVNPRLATDNIITTNTMLEYARIRGIKKFIFSSSREVYGNTDSSVHAEDDVDIRYTESPYTASKIAGEALVWSYNRCYHIDAIIFRFSNVYGMYDVSDRVIPLYFRNCRDGKDLTVFGMEKELDFTYIDDVVRGILQAIDRFDVAKNDVFNLAGHQVVRLYGLAEQMIRRLHPKGQIKVLDTRVGEVMRYEADITHARDVLGFEPQYGFDDSLEKTIRWYSENT